MAISIQSLKRMRSADPPRILIYGPEKVGKTSLATEFPAPVFLQTETGTGLLELDTFGKLESYGQVSEAIGSLLNEPHDFHTVVLDSATAMQSLIWAETCARGDDKGTKKNRIEDFGYGKGYVYAVQVWQELLQGFELLRKERGLSVVFIAHAKSDRFDDPETVSYTKWDIDLHEKARDFLKREFDAIFLVKPDVTIKTEDAGFNKARAIGSGGRKVWINTTSVPAYVAGNRYAMPEKLLYEPGKGFAAISPFIPFFNTAAPAAQAAE